MANTDPHIAEAEARAAALIEKAKQESHILRNLPDIGMRPLVIIQKGIPWVSYKPDSLQDVIEAYSAFPPLDALDCKGRYRRITADGRYDEAAHGEIRGVYQGWIEISARCQDYISAAQSADVRFFADVPKVGAVQVGFALSDGLWNKCAYPAALRVTFSNSSRSGRAIGAWSARAPRANSDDSITYATGAPAPGMAYSGVLLFSDLRNALRDLQGEQK